MRLAPIMLLVTTVAVTVGHGQSQLPADIHPESLSRLPPCWMGESG